MRTIKILSSGPIRAMGMVHGPILTPYTVEDNKLRALVREGLNVVEISSDGSEKKLTIDDVNRPAGNGKNNNQKTAPKKEAAPTSTPAAPVKEPVKETTPVVETAKAEEVKEEVKETASAEDKNNKKK